MKMTGYITVGVLMIIPFSASGDSGASALEFALRRADEQSRLPEISRLLESELTKYSSSGSEVPTALARATSVVKIAQSDASQTNRKKTTIRKPNDFFLLENKTKFSLSRMKGRLSAPVAAAIDTRFGTEKLVGTITEIRHTGLTYRVPTGTDVVAVADGLVVYAQTFPGFGLTAIVDHGTSTHSIYAHLDALGVIQGDSVKQNQVLAASGASDSFDGPKLYFELRVKGSAIDPAPFLLK